MNERVLLDLSVLRPVPRGVVLCGDPARGWPVMSVVDMKYKDVIRLFELDNEATNDDSMLNNFHRLGEQVKLLCPSMPDEVLAELTYRDRRDFYRASVQATPPPLAEELNRLLRVRPLPCEGACEHGKECEAARELWALKERLTAVPLPEAPAPAPA